MCCIFGWRFDRELSFSLESMINRCFWHSVDLPQQVVSQSWGRAAAD